MKKRPLSFPFLFAAVLALLLIVAVIVVIVRHTAKPAEYDSIAEGIAYLEALEKKDPDKVNQVRKEIQQKKLDAQRDALIAQLQDGTLDPFSFFKDSVIMGDSRVVGFWYYNFVDQGQVLADGGNTIRNISDHMETLVSLNPATIYLCYGLNDISIGFWSTPQEYVTEYMQIIQDIQARLPKATIVVSSILPAQDPAFQQSKKWYDIPKWSAALEQACKEHHIPFANCDNLAKEHPDLWDVDGIHFRQALYPYWSSNLVVGQLMEEQE